MKPGGEGILGKARHSIHTAEVLLSQREAEIAVGRAYYAMFYAAEALRWVPGEGWIEGRK